MNHHLLMNLNRWLFYLLMMDSIGSSSCLTTGVRRESSNKFNKLVAKGEITTTVIPFPIAGSRAQDISAAEFKELLTASLYDAQATLVLCSRSMRLPGASLRG